MIREHILFSTAHGSPYDRGGADSWYGREPKPHWYPNGTGSEPRITERDMTPDEIAAYWAGYEDNEAEGGKKDYT
jgi:hypothetical protein